MEVPLDYVEDREIYKKVIENGLLTAARSVWIATANIKNIYIRHHGDYDTIVHVFETLLARGVELRILHSSVPSESFLEALKKTDICKNPRFQMQRCPRVHFKVVLIDGERLFLGSANLTGAGVGAKSDSRRNFEIGILTSDCGIIDRVEYYFDSIWQGRECEGCGRKKVCPVPLERPDF